MSREYQYVKSSNIQGVAYNDDSREMTIQFNNGSEYAYEDVSKEEYESLVNAPSVGQYFHDNIKNTYRTRRV